MRLLPALLLLIISNLGLQQVWADESEMQIQKLKPCIRVESDVGGDAKERQAKARFYAKKIAETSSFFMKVFDLKAQHFVEYATKRHSEQNPYETDIRVRIWRRRQDFLKDFQTRYETKTIPGAFFGIIQHKDEYGNKGAWFREIGACAEGATDEQVLRSLYHEMGHLYMRTFMFWPVEVPSWMEEGTAELFQFRKGNGTKPEEERMQRLGWIYEMIHLEENSMGASIDWKDFTAVRNAHNLDFTHQNPLRSTIQYVQAWSVMEFMIASSARGRAYTKLLHIIKNEAMQANGEAQRKGLKGKAYFNYINQRIYNKQYDMFKQAYKADVLSVEGKWKEWVKKDCEKQQRRSPELYYHRGVWHMQYRARFARDPEKKKAILAKAEAIFKEGIEESPKAAEPYVGMGRLMMERGDIAATGEWFGKAAELGTENFEALLYGGVAKLHSGDATSALEPLSQAIEQRPTHFEANYHYGVALATDGKDYDKAIAHLTRAADLRPNQRGKPSMMAAVATILKGDLNRANILFIRAQNSLGNDRLLTMLMAALKAQNTDFAGAEAILAPLAGQGDGLAGRLLEMIKKGESPDIAFSPRGRPGIVGVTIKQASTEQPQAADDSM